MTRACVECGEPLAEWSRVDRETCSVGCRVRRWRRAQAEKRERAECMAGTGGRPRSQAVKAVTSEVVTW